MSKHKTTNSKWMGNKQIALFVAFKVISFMSRGRDITGNNHRYFFVDSAFFYGTVEICDEEQTLLQVIGGYLLSFCD
jgi:hypothetical protein